MPARAMAALASALWPALRWLVDALLCAAPCGCTPQVLAALAGAFRWPAQDPGLAALPALLGVMPWFPSYNVTNRLLDIE